MELGVCSESCSALSLMERVLRDGASLAREYPLVFDAGAPGRLIVAEEEGEIRSTCALLTRELVLPGCSFNVGMIGSVSTHPDYRGRGLGAAILARAEEELRADGCLFSLLWAEDPGFYERRGYSAIGSEWDYSIDEAVVSRLPEAAGVRTARSEDAAAIRAAYVNHAARVERSVDEMRTMLDRISMTTFVWEGAAGAFAYACLGRGDDLVGVVHEWGGDPEGVLRCLNAAWKRRREERGGDSIFLMAPAGRTGGELKQALVERGALCCAGILGMGRMLRPDLALDLLVSRVEPGGRSESLRAALIEDGASPQRLLGLLLPPRGDRTQLRELESRLGISLVGLPLEAFVWGLDSI